MVTKPKALGGLGLISMRQVNSTFLAKLDWCALNESTFLRLGFHLVSTIGAGVVRRHAGKVNASND